MSLSTGGLSGLAQELMTEFADSLPGIDEAKGFMDILGYVCACVCVFVDIREVCTYIIYVNVFLRLQCEL